MSIEPKKATIYKSWPWQNWAFGTFLIALLSMYFTMAIWEGVPLMAWQAWPAYAVTAIFLPLAVLMLSARSAHVVVGDRGELFVIRRRILGAPTTRDVSLKAPQTVEVSAIVSNDSDTYRIDIIDHNGNRQHVTAQQIDSRVRAEAIASLIRSRIEAATSGTGRR